jgi:DNA-binding NtrC family response regulator
MSARAAISPSHEQERPLMPLLGSDGEFRKLHDIREEVRVYALARHGGNVAKAAVALGIGRTTLYRMLQDAKEPSHLGRDTVR